MNHRESLPIATKARHQQGGRSITLFGRHLDGNAVLPSRAVSFVEDCVIGSVTRFYSSPFRRSAPLLRGSVDARTGGMLVSKTVSERGSHTRQGAKKGEKGGR